jgi:hypothetical protein
MTGHVLRVPFSYAFLFFVEEGVDGLQHEAQVT